MSKTSFSKVAKSGPSASSMTKGGGLNIPSQFGRAQSALPATPRVKPSMPATGRAPKTASINAKQKFGK